MHQEGSEKQEQISQMCIMFGSVTHGVGARMGTGHDRCSRNAGRNRVASSLTMTLACEPRAATVWGKSLPSRGSKSES